MLSDAIIAVLTSADHEHLIFVTNGHAQQPRSSIPCISGVSLIPSFCPGIMCTLI